MSVNQKYHRNHRRGNRIYKRMQATLTLVFFACLALFCVILGRVISIQAKDGPKYAKQVLSQMSYQNRVIPYKRGDIVDSKGTTLATSIDVYNVVLDCKALKEEKKNKKGIIESTAKYVHQYFPDIKESAVTDAVEKHPKSQYTVLKKRESYERMKAFSDFSSSKKGKKAVAGIWFEKEYKRQYPYPNLASQLIGFVASGNTGVTGLENQYNSVLNGTDGRSFGYQNEDNSVENSVIEPVNGNTIQTSLDVFTQQTVNNAVTKFNKRMEKAAGNHKRGSKNTAVLVMNPNNGQIYAMATYPSFSLNKPRKLSSLYTKQELSGMSSKDQLDALNGLWQNFPVSHTFEPGSTFKPFTVAAGLETGRLKDSDTFLCDGGMKFADNVYVKCESHHGIETVRKALMDSCNDSLMQIGLRLGAKNFEFYQHLFGFGQKTGVDLPGEPRTNTLLYSEKELQRTPVNLATNAFGQNFNVTMIQIASGYCSLINGGNYYKPTVVTKVEDDSGNTVSKNDPELLKKTISKETSDQIRSYLKSVVTGGTGVTAQVKGYSIGGKTGTAEKQPRKQGNYLVSFIGFAPVESPKLLVYVVVDEPNAPDQAHSKFAQEIAHDIFKTLLPYYNIEKTSKKKNSKK
ncbi:MAG: penicillin-binding protein 2 [Lachnospiraceae bacterium]|uniref:Penicillin-binding protein 2 n=1 Tax=Candidatus Weimeria bifida TaxID=2599074 RepID=A0A6N7IWW2_9FIRM|nr:penicillin-binding protein 2 [Candidatus Weimeria bifida]RRF96250.1 MAG: penicillin-binding protein 2 [Lachnospiraceae bacterium]